jgi:hypothetical protein
MKRSRGAEGQRSGGVKAKATAECRISHFEGNAEGADKQKGRYLIEIAPFYSLGRLFTS